MNYIRLFSSSARTADEAGAKVASSSSPTLIDRYAVIDARRVTPAHMID